MSTNSPKRPVGKMISELVATSQRLVAAMAQAAEDDRYTHAERAALRSFAAYVPAAFERVEILTRTIATALPSQREGAVVAALLRGMADADEKQRRELAFIAETASHLTPSARESLHILADASGSTGLMRSTAGLIEAAAEQ